MFPLDRSPRSRTRRKASRAWATAALGALLIIVVESALAQDFTTPQRNALNHFAQASAAAVFCPDLNLNTGTAAAMFMLFGLDLERQRERQYVMQLVPQHISGLEAAGREVGCRVALALYGPGGENVKNLLRRGD